MILGCAGKSLTREDINFYRNECPWAFILLARNSGETEQTRDLAAEWAKYGVRVNAVAPGWIKSVMTERLQNNDTMSKRMLGRVPMARWGAPEDIAGPVAFLASDAASYITGQVLAIDGGASSIIPISTEPEAF